jgi:hypothetical protein
MPTSRQGFDGFEPTLARNVSRSRLAGWERRQMVLGADC